MVYIVLLVFWSGKIRIHFHLLLPGIYTECAELLGAECLAYDPDQPLFLACS